jgi:hypothetical protein
MKYPKIDIGGLAFNGLCPSESAIFWVVWNPAGHTPLIRHTSEKVAKTEALRLASANPGKQFHVLKSRGYARVAVPVTPPAAFVAAF